MTRSDLLVRLLLVCVIAGLIIALFLSSGIEEPPLPGRTPADYFLVLEAEDVPDLPAAMQKKTAGDSSGEILVIPEGTLKSKQRVPSALIPFDIGQKGDSKVWLRTLWNDT